MHLVNCKYELYQAGRKTYTRSKRDIVGGPSGHIKIQDVLFFPLFCWIMVEEYKRPGKATITEQLHITTIINSAAALDIRGWSGFTIAKYLKYNMYLQITFI